MFSFSSKFLHWSVDKSGDYPSWTNDPYTRQARFASKPSESSWLRHPIHLADAESRLPKAGAAPVSHIPANHGEKESYAAAELPWVPRDQGPARHRPARSRRPEARYDQSGSPSRYIESRSVRSAQWSCPDHAALPQYKARPHWFLNTESQPSVPAAESTACERPDRLQKHDDCSWLLDKRIVCRRAC